MNIDPRFAQEAGREIFTGNELLVKGALETTGGVHLLTGYPGPPVAGFFDVLRGLGPLFAPKGVVARLAQTEAISVAMVNGARLAGCRAITVVGSTPLLAAGDTLAMGMQNATHAESGGVVVWGDDLPGHSRHLLADSRFLAQQVFMPLLEPSCSQEVKDWINLAFKLSGAGQTMIGCMVAATMADGGGSVTCAPNHFPVVNKRQRRVLGDDRDMASAPVRSVSPQPRQGPARFLESRFDALKGLARELGINRVHHQPQKGELVAMGFVASGQAYAYLNHALAEMGLVGRVPVLKLGLTYPLDEQMVIDFARQCTTMIVIEEGRDFVESQVRQILLPSIQTGERDTKIYGKRFPGSRPGIPAAGGLNPSVLIERLIPLFKDHPTLSNQRINVNLTAELDRLRLTAIGQVKIPDRIPTFCPGCPHRDSSSVLLGLCKDLRDSQYMLEHHKRKPVNLILHGDSGCQSLFGMDPSKPWIHNHDGSGFAGAAASGLDPFIENKQIAFLGDGAFFHGGQTTISHAIKVGQDITFIILNNQTTAMAGQLPNPGIGYDLTGRPTAVQDIERVVRAMVPRERGKSVNIVRINPADHKRYRRLLEQTVLSDGLKVVIADKECGITYYRRLGAEADQVVKSQGYLPRQTHMNIATAVCDNCLECTKTTGCPGLTIVDTAYGPKVQTDLSSCVNDGACQRVDACPSFEQVTVVRQQPVPQRHWQINLADLPCPPRPIHAEQKIWRCYLAGVGGMGMGLCLKVLAEAGHKMDYHVQFLHDKGVAVRTGSVSCQLAYTRLEAPPDGTDQPSKEADAATTTTAAIPYGKADLILGIDLLEAVRGLDPNGPNRIWAPDRTAAVINTARPQTTRSIMGFEDLQPQRLQAVVRRHTHREHYAGFDVSDVCERMFGSRQYVNTMTLGIAYQKGFLPVTLQAIDQAIGGVVGHDVVRHNRAFGVGRKMVVDPRFFGVQVQHRLETTGKGLGPVRKQNRHRYRSGKRAAQRARQFGGLVKQTLRVPGDRRLDDQMVRDVAIRAYDCLTWGGIDYARRYCQRLTQIFQKDDPNAHYAVSRAVVWNLAKVMLIKDEIYVAAMLSSPQKIKADYKRFNVNANNGDRIIYRYHHRPEFKVWGRRIAFEWASRRWQLRLMSRMRFLREVFPGWHQRERAFRDWYEQLVDRFDWEPTQGSREYQRWLAVLSVPESVTGYRQVRYPKMEAARQRAEQLLATDLEVFEPQGAVLAQGKPTPGTVRLPILT